MRNNNDLRIIKVSKEILSEIDNIEKKIIEKINESEERIDSFSQQFSKKLENLNEEKIVVKNELEKYLVLMNKLDKFKNYNISINDFDNDQIIREISKILIAENNKYLEKTKKIISDENTEVINIYNNKSKRSIEHIYGAITSNIEVMKETSLELIHIEIFLEKFLHLFSKTEILNEHVKLDVLKATEINIKTNSFYSDLFEYSVAVKIKKLSSDIDKLKEENKNLTIEKRKSIWELLNDILEKEKSIFNF